MISDAVLWLFCLQISIPLSSEAAVSTPTFTRRMRRASSWWTPPRLRRRPTRGTAWGLLRYDKHTGCSPSTYMCRFWSFKCLFCFIWTNNMTFVWTEEPAQGQGPQEPDPVQHADAAEERQAEGEVRLCRNFQMTSCDSAQAKKNPNTRSCHVNGWSCCKGFSLTSCLCLFRDRMRLQKKFQKQFGVRQKWDQKSQVSIRLFLLVD